MMEWLSNDGIIAVIVLGILGGLCLGAAEATFKIPARETTSRVLYIVTGGIWFSAILLMSVTVVWSDPRWYNWFYGLVFIPGLGVLAFIFREMGSNITKRLLAMKGWSP